MPKKTYQVRVDPALHADIDVRAERQGLSAAEHATRLLELDLGLVHQHQLTFMTMESPCYYMDRDLCVTHANLAAVALLKFRQSALQNGEKISPRELEEILEGALDAESYEAEQKHFRDTFLLEDGTPSERGKKLRFDESPRPVTARPGEFGKVTMHRRGLRRKRGGWVVVWNIRGVEKQEALRSNWLNLLDVWLMGQGE